jgi:acetyl esterase/lipase
MMIEMSARRVRNGVAAMGMAFVLGAGVAGLGAVAPAQAQMPPDIVAKIAALGRVVDPENTAKIYAPLLEQEPYAGIRLTRDVKYGASPRNVLDIFAADNAAAGHPVLMFVHGGGFVRGIKHAPGSPFYDNIMLFAARHGMIGFNVEYRLAPDATWPSGIEDLGAAIAFVRDNIASYGGDPNRVFLMGHSAGASHVAGYISHPDFFGPKGPGIVGAILSSGSYQLNAEDIGRDQVAYYGSDASLYAKRAPLTGIVKTSIPFMMSGAELDPPPIAAQFAMLKEAMCKSERGCMRSILLPHHSHMSESYSIDTADRQLSDQILDFISTGK